MIIFREQTESGHVNRVPLNSLRTVTDRLCVDLTGAICTLEMIQQKKFPALPGVDDAQIANSLALITVIRRSLGAEQLFGQERALQELAAV